MCGICSRTTRMRRAQVSRHGSGYRWCLEDKWTISTHRRNIMTPKKVSRSSSSFLRGPDLTNSRGKIGAFCWLALLSNRRLELCLALALPLLRAEAMRSTCAMFSFCDLAPCQFRPVFRPVRS